MAVLNRKHERNLCGVPATDGYRCATGSWLLPGEINPVKVDHVTSRVRVDANSWLKDEDQQPRMEQWGKAK